MKLQCNSCNGTYDDTQPDGARTYHVCPPEIITYATFDTNGKQLTPETRAPRPNIRDERITGYDTDTGKVIIVSEGLGVTQL
jgi:hypothetical protein